MATTLTNVDTSKWNVIYPNYLNSKKTVQEGRKMPIASSVDNPSINEIAAALKALGINTKAYPRDWLDKGRVKCQLKEDDKLIKEEWTSMNEPTTRTNQAERGVLKAIGEHIQLARTKNLAAAPKGKKNKKK